MIAGMHNIKEARIGDTIYHQNKAVEPLPGFKAARPMVFYTSSIFRHLFISIYFFLMHHLTVLELLFFRFHYERDCKIQKYL